MEKFSLMLFAALSLSGASFGQKDFSEKEPTGKKVTWQGDLSRKMVMGIDSFLLAETRNTKWRRQSEWLSNSQSDPAVQQKFLSDKRTQLQKTWGMTGNRKPAVLQTEINPLTLQPVVAAAGNLKIFPIKISVNDGLDMMGLLIQPNIPVKARMVVVPDADQTPEDLVGMTSAQPASADLPVLQLAAKGVQILIPALISRRQDLSGSAALNIYTNQPHREWIYRQGFNLGRHIIGYELERIAACIDWQETQNTLTNSPETPLSIAGYGEGGMLALFTTAIDKRVSAALISGYTGHSELLFEEPIYRNLHGILKLAGNAELLSLCSHADVLIEYSESPRVQNPNLMEGRRGGAAPGKLDTPPLNVLEEEIRQANTYKAGTISLISDNGKAFKSSFSKGAIEHVAKKLRLSGNDKIKRPGREKYWPDSGIREKMLFQQLESLIQWELSVCENRRNQTFWAKIKQDPSKDEIEKQKLREGLYQTIGKISTPLSNPDPKVRLLETTAKWRKYEVVLDVWESVFAWGILFVPNSPGQTAPYPVVVCQHGLEGLPEDLITRDPADPNSGVYKSMAVDLAERGYVTFSPHNPYRGEHLFRGLQRKANPIGLSLFSFIAGQHQQIVNWLGSQPFVDKKRIGFYGLSYGGKTAMRVPALVEGYALSICSGDFNEWIRKVASVTLPYSYQFTKEYEIYEWDLGNHFNYAEMAGLIAPRPFMVEYGYKDGIGSAEWIGYEFGKVRRHYDTSGLSDRLSIDLFNGVHEIHATKTYLFLDKHLKN